MKEHLTSLLTPEVLQLIKVLKGKAYLVGGAVRDALLGLPVTDIDMASPFTPEESTALLEKAGYRVVPTGLKHGTVTVVLDSKKVVELTSFRTDEVTDGRHAKISYAKQMVQDASRRDFTFNALYLDKDGNLFDFFHGLKDLQNHVVRFIGQPEDRIAEDYLRILRFFRFWGRFGEGKPPLRAIKACQKMRDGLKKLSKERKRDELLKILALPNAARVIHFMKAYDVLDELFASQRILRPLRRLIKTQRDRWFFPHPLARLYILLKDPTDLPNFKFSNAQKDFLTHVHTVLQTPVRTHQQQSEVVYRYGKDVLIAATLIRYSLQNKSIPRPTARRLRHMTCPCFTITAADLQERWGLKGVELGATMKQAEQVWIDMNFPNKKELVLNALGR